MTVFGEEKCDKLRVNSFVGAEVSAKETADEVAVDRRVVTWEVDIFKSAETAFQVASEFLYLSRFACSVQAFEYY
jgi:hypothetical protein